MFLIPDDIPTATTGRIFSEERPVSACRYHPAIAGAIAGEEDHILCDATIPPVPGTTSITCGTCSAPATGCLSR